MRSQRQKTSEPKPKCLYHKDKECICIRPVVTEDQLRVRIRNREALAKYGIKA